MQKKLLLLFGIIIAGSIVNAEINMPSAPVYDIPSSSYKAPAKTIQGPTRTNFYVQGTNTDSRLDKPSSAYKKQTPSSKYYTEKDKKELYDAFEPEFFKSMKKEILKKGFSVKSTDELITQLEKNFNRAELEKSTWGCVSKYPPEELLNQQNTEKIFNTCFSDWTNKYIDDNKALAEKILKYPPKESD